MSESRDLTSCRLYALSRDRKRLPRTRKIVSMRRMILLLSRRYVSPYVMFSITHTSVKHMTRTQVPRAKAFFAMHLLYEDCKLSKTRWNMLKPLGHLLATIAHVSWSNQSSLVRAYIDHYRRDGGFFSIPHSRLKSSTTFSASLVKHEIQNLERFSENPPNIMSHLMNLIRGRSSKSLSCFDIPVGDSSTTSSQRLRRTQEICSYYEHLCDVNKVVTRMVKDGMTRDVLNSDVPFGVSLPLLQVLRRAKDNPPLNWPRSAYVLIQREDIASILERKRHCDDDEKTLSLELLVDNTNDEEDTQEIEQQQRDSLSTDGLKEIRVQSRLRFSEDRRVKEVSRLLRSSKPMRLVLDRHADTSDADLAAEQQSALKHLCARAMALPVARGMLTMSVTRPLLTEALPIPELVLAARLPPNGAIVKLDMSSQNEDTTYWPRFHNGVAAALRLGRSRESLTRTWIVYNRPKQPNYEHAGFLLALGLQGHLTCLRTTDFYMYVMFEREAREFLSYPRIIRVSMCITHSYHYTLKNYEYRLYYSPISSNVITTLTPTGTCLNVITLQRRVYFWVSQRIIEVRQMHPCSRCSVFIFQLFYPHRSRKSPHPRLFRSLLCWVLVCSIKLLHIVSLWNFFSRRSDVVLLREMRVIVQLEVVPVAAVRRDTLLLRDLVWDSLR